MNNEDDFFNDLPNLPASQLTKRMTVCQKASQVHRVRTQERELKRLRKKINQLQSSLRREAVDHIHVMNEASAEEEKEVPMREDVQMHNEGKQPAEAMAASEKVHPEANVIGNAQEVQEQADAAFAEGLAKEEEADKVDDLFTFSIGELNVDGMEVTGANPDQKSMRDHHMTKRKRNQRKFE